jgi:hypothetical protein
MTGMYAHQYTREPGSAFYGPHGTIPGDPSASLLFRTIDFVALNNILVPSANAAVSVRYGLNRFKDFGGNYPKFDAATLGFPADFVNAMTFNTFPTVSITGYNGLGNGGPSRTTHRTQTANASISYLMGSHTMKVGGEYRRMGATTRTFSSSAGTYSFSQNFTAATPTASGGDAFASFLLGYPASGSIVYATPAEYLVDYFAGYAQDEFRASSKLTMNYGLRYEFEDRVCAKRTSTSRWVRSRRHLPGAGAGHDAEGRPDVCGTERLPDAPGEAAQRRRAARRFRVVAFEQGRDPRRLRLLLGPDRVRGRRRDRHGAPGLHGHNDVSLEQ